jgi:hypothetical protein
MRYLLGLFLVGHALIHFSYLTPAPPQTAGGPEWPFAMSKSWLVANLGMSADLVRPIGIVLIAITVICMVGAGLAAAGLIIGEEWWQPLVVTGALASLAVLGIFFHPWIVIGLAIDAILLFLVLVTGWNPIEALVGS